MKDKFACPLCNGTLFFWKEFVYQENQYIDKQTGFLKKRIIKSEPQEADTNGIECQKCNVTWSGSACDFSDIRIEKIFDLINKSSKAQTSSE